MKKLKPDATGIYVAAHQAPGAIEEAIEAEVPLVVAVAEHIPIHDMLRVCSILFSTALTLTNADTFNAKDAVKIPVSRSQCSWHYICNRKVQNWVSTSSMLHAWPDRYCG